MEHSTPKRELIQVRLGRDLAAYVAAARAEGRDWRTIAADLTAVTGVAVSHESLRVWFARDAA